jgi:putative transposase
LNLASDRGLPLTGPDGLLKQLTKNVLETALNEEMTEILPPPQTKPQVRAGSVGHHGPGSGVRCKQDVG